MVPWGDPVVDKVTFESCLFNLKLHRGLSIGYLIGHSVFKSTPNKISFGLPVMFNTNTIICDKTERAITFTATMPRKDNQEILAS